MFARIYEPDLTIVSYGEKFRQVYFIQEGAVSMFNKFIISDFMLLPPFSIFGDYQILCDIKSNITFRTAKHSPQTRFMCVDRKVFLNLCDLFPVTQENLRERGMQKRLHYLKAMKCQDKQEKKKALTRSTKLEEFNKPLNFFENVSQDSLLDQKTLEALGNAAKGVAEQLNTNHREESDTTDPPTKGSYSVKKI